jgi:hypothetical protein
MRGMIYDIKKVFKRKRRTRTDVQTVLTTNASTLLNAGHRAVGAIVGRDWLAAGALVGGALLAGLSVL